MNLEKMDKLPDSLLTDITEKPTEQVASSVSQQAPPSPISEVSREEIFSAGDTAKIEPLSASPEGLDGAKVQTSQTSTAKSIPIGGMIGGKLVVDMIDLLLPSLLSYAVSFIGYSMDKKALQMTAKEKEFVSPYMTEYLNSINVNLNNPFYNLMLVFGSVYAGKFMEVLPQMKKVEKEKPSTEKKVVAIVDKLQAQVEKQKSIEDFIKEIAPLDREIAIKMVMDRRSKGKADAITWYNKNVKQRRA